MIDWFFKSRIRISFHHELTLQRITSYLLSSLNGFLQVYYNHIVWWQLRQSVLSVWELEIMQMVAANKPLHAPVRLTQIWRCCCCFAGVHLFTRLPGWFLPWRHASPERWSHWVTADNLHNRSAITQPSLRQGECPRVSETIYIIIRHCPGVGAFPRPFCVPNSVALASLTLQVGDWAIH